MTHRVFQQCITKLWPPTLRTRRIRSVMASVVISIYIRAEQSDHNVSCLRPVGRVHGEACLAALAAGRAHRVGERASGTHETKKN